MLPAIAPVIAVQRNSSSPKPRRFGMTTIKTPCSPSLPGELLTQRLYDAVEILQRGVLHHDLALALVVTNHDTHSERALHLLLGSANVWIYRALWLCFLLASILWSQHAMNQLFGLADRQRGRANLLRRCKDRFGRIEHKQSFRVTRGELSFLDRLLDAFRQAQKANQVCY